MACKIHCKWDGNTKGAEELTTDRKGWSTLNDVCGKERKKERKPQNHIGDWNIIQEKWCYFTYTSIRKSVRC